MDARQVQERRTRSLVGVAELQARRTRLEKEMMNLWIEHERNSGKKIKVDAVICLVAPHQVPEIERYNAAGYTSSWTLLEYPAGVIPVRTFNETDLGLIGNP